MNLRCDRQFVNGNCGAAVICFCDLCHEGEPECSPESCECGPIDSFVAVNP